MDDEPQGLDALIEMPEGGLYDDSDPEGSLITEAERIIPEKWAKSNCKYCHGKGEVKQHLKEGKELCRCVQIRVARELGPRR